MEVYVGGKVDIVEDGEVVAGIVIGEVAIKEELSPYPSMVDGLGKGGVGVVWWKDLLVVVVLEKVKEVVVIWWSFGVCGIVNGVGGGRR